ncbi:MAG: metalloprotease PmbA [Neisseriaceae bacterium]|nr:metalloprotease PmbA [Neisseriaceae bacterium]
MFVCSQNDLLNLSEDVLRYAKQGGADGAAVDVYESTGLEVSVRMQETEKVAYRRDTGVEVAVFVGKKKGYASTADLSPNAVKQTVAAALNIARFTQDDECSGLPEPELLATDLFDLDLYHPKTLSPDEAVAIAKECEDAALKEDARITNSEGAEVASDESQSVFANSLGFSAYDKRTRYALSCVAVASSHGGMQRDYWSDATRSFDDLSSADEIGKTAANRVLARLNSGSLKTGVYPVLFDFMVSGSLIAHLVGALSGGALYRKSSFLCDSLGKKILPDFVKLREEPHLKRAFSVAVCDDEGVATKPRTVIDNGVIQGYFLSSYSARKLGLTTTGNAGGVHHLCLNPTVSTQQDLLKQMGTGLLVTELMGQGVNLLTGDYSRGASGFWVENGVIAYPVEEITIAGRLQDMFAQIIGIANDARPHSSHSVGSILVEQMTVAGQ